MSGYRLFSCAASAMVMDAMEGELLGLLVGLNGTTELALRQSNQATKLSADSAEQGMKARYGYWELE